MLGKHLAQASLPFSISRLRNPSSHSPFEGASRKLCPTPEKSHPQGLATLSVAYVPKSVEASSSSRHSWALPSKAFLLHSGPQKVSLSGFRSCASLHNLRGLASALQRLSHHESRAPYLLPEGLVQAGTSCSLGLFGLPGFLSKRPTRKSSPFPGAPLALISSPPHSEKENEPQGLTFRPKRRLPRRGACLLDLLGRPLSPSL